MSLRQIARSLIDGAALYAAFAIQWSASQSLAASLVTAGLLCAYSCWCYWDGYSTRARRPDLADSGRNGE
jgi:hypothetical protein